MMEKQQFYHMLIIPVSIRIVEVKDVVAFSKDPKQNEKRLEVFINLTTIASQGAITFCKIIPRLKVLLPQPHTGV